MESKVAVVIFGSFIGLIKLVDKKYKVAQVVCEKSKIDKELLDLCNDIEAETVIVEQSSDFEKIIAGDIGICYGFGKKISRKVMRLFGRGIVNFHPGDLRYYRGRHPIGWALIEQKSNLILTSHIITQEFDLGFVVEEELINFDEEDTEYSIRQKVESAILDFFLVRTLTSVFDEQSKFVFIENGRYLPSLANKYDEISSRDHDSGFIIGLLRAKYDYGGIKINGIPVLKAEIVNSLTVSTTDDHLIFSCRDDAVLRVVKK